MSAVESAQRAARLTDPIGHGWEMLGMMGVMSLGAVIGVVLLAGAILTGGALLGVIAAVACVAGGGLAGGQLAQGLQKATGQPDPQTGILGPIASPNVRIGKLFATRATDTALSCDGIMTLLHPLPIPMVPIAEGAKTVLINNLPAARVTSKLVCGAKIKDGEPTVVIGGPTKRLLKVHDEEELSAVLNKMMLVSMFGVVLLEPLAIIPILGFLVVNEGVGDLADKMFGKDSGARDIAQGLLGLGALVGGGRLLRGRGSKGGRALKPRSGGKYSDKTMEMSDYGRRWDRNHPVEIFDQAKLENHRVVEGEDGKLVYANSGKPVNSPYGEAIYVMDEHGNFYVHENPEVGRIHHSSLAGGNDPVAAGHITAEDGKVTDLNEQTGHYGENQPIGRSELAKQELGSQGVDVSDTKATPWQ